MIPGPGETTVEFVIAFLGCTPEISVELRTSGVLLRGGLGSSDKCSTWNLSESDEINKEFADTFEMKQIEELNC